MVRMGTGRREERWTTAAASSSSAAVPPLLAPPIAAPNHHHLPLDLHEFDVLWPSSPSSRPKPPLGHGPAPPADRRRPLQISAPVSVPFRRRPRGDDPPGDEPPEPAAATLPPHLLAERSRAAASSVFEGLGRTLKGRDLRSVRNAVLRKTGFLD